MVIRKYQYRKFAHVTFSYIKCDFLGYSPFAVIIAHYPDKTPIINRITGGSPSRLRYPIPVWARINQALIAFP